MSEEQKNKNQNTCCEPSCCNCCDNDAVAKFLRHVASFFDKKN